MLPGFRFLFAAIVLSMSVLVFGLGAAALLRAAHEQFASLPLRPGPPEPVFAQRNQATIPVLAMLRVDPPSGEKPSETAPAAAAPTEQVATVSAPVEPEPTAALKPEDSTPPETAKPEIAIPEASPQQAAVSAQADAPTAPDETRIVAAEPTLPPANEVAPIMSEQPSTPASADSEIAATKIATLGGPPVAIETQPPANQAGAKPDRSVIKKRQQARRAIQRRKAAARALLARQALQQQPANPFAQPIGN